VGPNPQGSETGIDKLIEATGRERLPDEAVVGYSRLFQAVGARQAISRQCWNRSRVIWR
jgi:hypothetical protein